MTYFLLELQILQPNFESKINVNVSKIGPCYKVGLNEGADTIEGCLPFVYYQFHSGVQGICVILRLDISSLASWLLPFMEASLRQSFTSAAVRRTDWRVRKVTTALSRHKMIAMSANSLTVEVL